MAAREHVQAVHGPSCGCILHRHERAAAALKGQTAVAASAPKLERLAEVSAAVTQILADPALKPKKLRKAAAAVTLNAGSTEESRKRGRPRVLSDEQRRERGRQRVAGWRAAKAGKAVAS